MTSVFEEHLIELRYFKTVGKQSHTGILERAIDKCIKDKRNFATDIHNILRLGNTAPFLLEGQRGRTITSPSLPGYFNPFLMFVSFSVRMTSSISGR